MADVKENLLALEIFEDNIYLQYYINLIQNNINTQAKKFKTQKHHVIPVGYYKYKFKLKNRTEAEKAANRDYNNFIVNLLYKDHILAHYYLCLCVKASELKLKYSFEHSFFHLVQADANNKKKLTSDEVAEIITKLDDFQTLYEQYKHLNSELQKGKSSWNKGLTKEIDERVAKCSKPRHFSKEHNEHNRQSLLNYYKTHDGTMKGKQLSEEAKQKLSKAHKGRYSPSKNPEITRQKLSIKSKKYWETHPEVKVALIQYNKTRVLSDDTIKKMKESQKTRFPVIQLDSNKNVVNEFVSINDAARECGIGRWRIDNACKTGQLLKEGYYFKYKIKDGEK